MAARSGDSRVEAATLCRLLGDWPEAGRTLPDALAPPDGSGRLP